MCWCCSIREIPLRWVVTGLVVGFCLLLIGFAFELHSLRVHQNDLKNETAARIAEDAQFGSLARCRILRTATLNQRDVLAELEPLYGIAASTASSKIFRAQAAAQIPRIEVDLARIRIPVCS